MFKIKHSQLNSLLAAMILAVMGVSIVSIAPASAQPAIVIDGGYGVRRSPAVGSFIYGSPILTPMPVDPATGLMPQRNNYPNYDYPQVRHNVAPGSAQRVIIIDGGYGVQRSPAVGSFIYGSPILTPMPVDPATGLMPQRNHYPNYDYPQVRHNVRNSTLINPTIQDSTLVNPVIINNSWHRTRFRGGQCLTTSCFAPTRIFITYPR